MGLEMIIGLIVAALAAIAGAFGLGKSRGTSIAETKADRMGYESLDKDEQAAINLPASMIRLLKQREGEGIASFCPYNIGPGKCYPSTFYQRINAGDRKGACEAIRWWIKDGGRDCRLTKGQKNGCYGQVERRDQESALACWGLDQ